MELFALSLDVSTNGSESQWFGSDQLPIDHQPQFSEQSKSSKIEGKNRKVLVVDDEMLIRNLITDLLENVNFTVDSAKDGLEGLSIYLNNPFQYDLIILDMRMPNMDGETLFYKLKAANPSQKILICSGYSNIDHVESMIDAGALGLLSKPFTLQTFYNEIQKHVS